MSEPIPEQPGGRPTPSRARRIGILAAAVVLLSALILVAIPVIAGIVGGQGQTYTSKTGHFSISFPGKPKVTAPPTGATVVQWSGRNKTLLVQSRVLTADEKAKSDADVARSALTRGSEILGGKITKPISATTLAGHTGYVVTFSIGGKDFVRQAAIVHAGRLVALILLNPTDAESSHFLGSLAFTN